MNLSQPITTLVIATLAVWRLTHLFWGEDGPGDVFVRLRRVVGDGFFGRLLDCFYCLSVWVAAPFAWALGAGWSERVLLWLGLSGGAILLERATAEQPEVALPAVWQEKQRMTEDERGNETNILLQ